HSRKPRFTSRWEREFIRDSFVPNVNRFAFSRTKCQTSCMKNRPFWRKRIEALWKTKSIVWLAGVRRAGKTTLSQSLTGVEYFDCELPRVRRTLEDPEEFLASVRGKRIVLDEVHRLDNPSELLKIAADHYRHTHILATGSSTLGASAKFR